MLRIMGATPDGRVNTCAEILERAMAAVDRGENNFCSDDATTVGEDAVLLSLLL